METYHYVRIISENLFPIVESFFCDPDDLDNEVERFMDRSEFDKWPYTYDIVNREAYDQWLELEQELFDDTDDIDEPRHTNAWYSVGEYYFDHPPY